MVKYTAKKLSVEVFDPPTNGMLVWYPNNVAKEGVKITKDLKIVWNPTTGELQVLTADQVAANFDKA